MRPFTTKLWTIARVLHFVAALALAIGAFPASSIGQTREQDENAKSVPPVHYLRTLGPFSVDGRNFTVELNVICYKDSPHPGMCNEDDEETVKSVKIQDGGGRTRFDKSFRVAFMHQLERYNVTATLLNGSKHQALEIVYEKLPSHADTGVSIQLFGLRGGKLQAFNGDPLEFYGRLGELPPGQQKDSKNLLPGDILPIYTLTNYFYILVPVHVDWKSFDLEEQSAGEFDVVQQRPYERNPDIQSDGFVHLHSSPNQNSDDAGVNVTPKSDVRVLKARFRKGPPEEHDSPNEMWLKVSVDGKIGWILGLDDYTAIGLSSARQE
jgi:hypothetical protein